VSTPLSAPVIAATRLRGGNALVPRRGKPRRPGRQDRPGLRLHRDHLLGSAQDQWPDTAPELGQPFGIALPLDRLGVVLAEPVWAGEQPWRRDGQERPQLHQVVLQRRARDRDLHRRGQPTGALADLRLAVLGLLGLVGQEPGPAQLGVGREVNAQQGAGRDNDISARGELAESEAW
jgi:hypothetical protein